MSRTKKDAVNYFVLVMFLLFVAVSLYTLYGSQYSLFASSHGRRCPGRVLCAEEVLARHGLKRASLAATDQMLARYSNHLHSADMYVNECPEKKGGCDLARFSVSLQLNSGCRLQSRSADCPWSALDRALASTIDRCMVSYFKLSKSMRDGLTNACYMNL